MSNLLRKPKVDVVEKSEIRYERFRFTRNPFPISPGVTIGADDPRENGSIYYPGLVQREEEQFNELLIPRSNRSETKKIAFLMDYATRSGRGIGKTAFLNYERNKIMKDFGEELTGGEHVIFAVYVSPIPGENYNHPWKLSKLIIKKMVEQNIVSAAMCRLRAFSGIIPDEVLGKVGNDLTETLGDDYWLQNNQVNTMELNNKIRIELTKKNINAELSEKLALFGHNESLFCKYFFNNITLKDSYWRKDENRFLYTDLVKLFLYAGFTRGIILFDELEKVFPPLNRQERRVFIDSIRHCFIDGGSENTKKSFFELLLTIHPYLQELMIPHWEAAGLERFAALGGKSADDYTIYFKPIADTNAIPLAKEYMKKSRSAGEETNDLYPFEEQALMEALKIKKNVPGEFLSFLHNVIDKALDEGLEKIDIDIVKKVASVDPPVEPEMDDSDEPLKKSDTKLKE